MKLNWAPNMPNRILHERICVSETIAQLTSDEERFFYRLIVQCDDYGRFDGRASVIRARCFALQVDEVSDEDVSRWLAALERVGLVATYDVEGRSFLRVTTWERYQQTRAKRSKYPAPIGYLPESASNGYQMTADVPVKRESLKENRESLTTPQPPPQAEGERPMRQRGRPEISDEPKPGAPPPVPATPGDVAVWNQALGQIRPSDMTPGNLAQLAQLEPIGRAPDGGLQLRGPPGMHLDRFRAHVARALLDAGDASASRVAIVEG